MFNQEFREKLSEEDIVERDNIKPILNFFEKLIEKQNSESYFTCVNVRKFNKRKYVSLEVNALDQREITVLLFRYCFPSLSFT